ncbi:hypothetical protein MAR_000208, partial [Mya arenaria]
MLVYCGMAIHTQLLVARGNLSQGHGMIDITAAIHQHGLIWYSRTLGHPPSCRLKPGEFKMSNDSLPAKKNPSITSDIYETLKGEVQQYVNIPEQEDYMNPTKESKSSPGPPPPPRTLESTNSLRSLDMNNLPRSVDVKPPPPPTWEDSQGRPPPPPSREDSQVSISRSDGVLFSKGSMTDLHKAGEAVGQAGPKTRVFKRDPYAGVPREPGMLRPKHSAFDSGLLIS